MRLVNGRVHTRAGDIPRDYIENITEGAEFGDADGFSVPLNYKNAYALCSSGVPCVSPMALFYTYPHAPGIKPYRHQRQGAEFLAARRRAYLLMEPGTGKTLTAAWAADFLLKIGEIDVVLVVAPKSTLLSAWGGDLSRNLPHLAFRSLAVSKSQRHYAMRTRTPVRLVNHDALGLFTNELYLNLKDQRVLVIIDESTAFKNVKSSRSRGMGDLLEALGEETRVWMLTGTPTAQGPEDAYGQIALMRNVDAYAKPAPPARLAAKTRFMSLDMWRKLTTVSTSRGPHLPEKRKASASAEVTVRRYMSPAFVRRLRDCVDLPPLVYEPPVLVAYSKEQTDALKTLRREGRLEAEGHVVNAAMAASLLSKVLQIGCGVAYSDPLFSPMPGEDDTPLAGGRTFLTFDTKAKDAEMVEAIRQAEGKAIVYVPFTAALKKVSKTLAKAGFKTTEIFGGQGAQDVADRVADFQQASDGADVIVAQPYKMSHGITATAASLTIWYGPIFRGETWIQANGRTARIGQKRTQVISVLAHEGVESGQFEILRGKTNAQEFLLDLYKRFLDGKI